MTRFDRMLGGGADEAQVARMWAGVGVRRIARARRVNVGRGLALVAAAAAIVFVVFALRKPGPLATRDASGVHAWASSDATHVVELDDGSAITLGPRSSVEPVENTGDRFCVLLREGSAHFSVKPGGPRRWIVEAGIATVEVVGTIFDVTREPAGVRVSVERGVVVVRGEHVPNRVRRLEAHESMLVPAAIAAIDEPLPPPSVSATAPEKLVEPTALPSTSASASASPDLLEEADRARREGRTEDALSLLGRVAASRDDARAALASFTRAKIELTDPSTLADATRDLERAIARGLPSPIDEEARARLVEAYEHAGRSDDARRAAEAYLVAHPNGRVAAEMRKKTAP